MGQDWDKTIVVKHRQDKGNLSVGLCCGGIWVGGTEDGRDRAKTIAQRVSQLLQRSWHRVTQNLLL